MHPRYVTPTKPGYRRLKRALYALNQVSTDIAIAILLGALMGGPAVLAVLFR
jgi:hypothetical protein